MVVKVSKPEINVREKISELDKPSGTAGQAMLAAETPQEQFNLIGAGRRNLTINGDFKVNQRGTLPITNPGSGVYLIDRWLMGSTSTNLVISNETGVYINQDNAKVKTLKALFSGSGGFDIYQIYEDWEYLSNKTVTISFWYRTNIHNCVIRQWSTMSPATIPSTNGEWKKFSTTFTLGTLIAGARAANTATLGIWTSSATVISGSYFEFTQFQLEVSKVATPFEHRSYGEELSLCERYYQNSFDEGEAPNVSSLNCIYLAAQPYSGSSIAGLSAKFSTPMRATPSVKIWTASPSSNNTVNRMSYYSGVWANAAVTLHESTSSKIVSISSSGVSSSTKLVQFNFEADAEL